MPLLVNPSPQKPYYDTSFAASFGQPFDLTGTTVPHPGTIPAQARGHSPVHDGSPSSTGSNPNSRGARASSEEKELTPGQKRRKEQNRAAYHHPRPPPPSTANRPSQRAFRERKERHVKELEQRLASLEQANSRAAAENDKLKAALEKTRLENRLLHENTLRGSGHSPPVEMPEVGPMAFKPLDHDSLRSNPPAIFTSPIFGEHPNRGPIHRITTSPSTGEKLLGAGAAWDLIMCHPLYEQGLVDIGDISERLKILARCDGQGPVFEESIILDAIQASRGSGRDELLVGGVIDY